jgi:drug/metabolite transporter (DMT)-like permease
MLQRVQSVFMLLVAIAMASILFLPIWHKQAGKQEATLDAYNLTISQAGAGGPSVQTQQTAIYLAILSGIAALLALYSIFQYRNRLTQIKINLANSLVMIGVLFGSWYLSNQGEKMLPAQELGNFQAGFYLIPIAMLMNILANRFIKRDEDLVRSVDRLR